MQANGNYSGLPRGITMNRINSTMLRPIAALLIMSMAGSVFAAPVESEVTCLAEDDFDPRDCDARRTARKSLANPLTNDLHPSIAFADGTGASAEAIGEGSMAFGIGARADGGTDIGLGQALAFGSGATATGWTSTAIGYNSNVGALGGIALGNGAKVNAGIDGDPSSGAMFGVAIGANAVVGPAYGDDWTANATSSVAIGQYAWASGDKSVALGADSRAEEDYTIAVGSESQRRRIVNMDAGTNNHDAVNVAQLKGVANSLGGGAGIDVDGTFINPTYDIQGQERRSVGDALDALDEGLEATNDRVDELEAGGGSGDDLIAQDAATGELSIGRNTNGTTVDFAGTDGARVLAGVADGVIAAGSQQAVNGGQLAEIRRELNGRVDTLDGRVEQLEENGIPGGGDGSGPGNDAGGRRIENVGDGVASSDAVNVGQMNTQVEQAVTTARAYTDQRVDAVSADLNRFKDEVNDRFSRQDDRISRVGAMGAALSQMAFSTQGVNTPNRLGVGVGSQGGKSALAVGYSRSIAPNVNLSFSGSVSGSEASAGVGVGIGW